MSTANLVLRNDFHNTSATVRVPESGIVSARAWARARAKLCPSQASGCTCGVVRGPQPDGPEYCIGPAPGAKGNTIIVNIG